MRIVHTEDFDANLARLPKQVHRLSAIQEERFKNNWRDPRLHVKKVRSFENVFSLRVTRLYLAFFYFQDVDTAVFFDIDHRKDIYR